jgi:hypothetical protein
MNRLLDKQAESRSGQSGAQPVNLWMQQEPSPLHFPLHLVSHRTQMNAELLLLIGVLQIVNAII